MHSITHCECLVIISWKNEQCSELENEKIYILWCQLYWVVWLAKVCWLRSHYSKRESFSVFWICTKYEWFWAFFYHWKLTLFPTIAMSLYHKWCSFNQGIHVKREWKVKKEYNTRSNEMVLHNKWAVSKRWKITDYREWNTTKCQSVLWQHTITTIFEATWQIQLMLTLYEYVQYGCYVVFLFSHMWSCNCLTLKFGRQNIGRLYKCVAGCQAQHWHQYHSRKVYQITAPVFNLNLLHASFCHYLRPQGAGGGAVISSQSIPCHISPV